jgi:hypothetical protein
VLLAAGGVLLGGVLGYAAAWAAGRPLFDTHGVQVIVGVTPTVPVLLLVGLLLGTAAGILSAAIAQRMPPDRHLAPA